MKKYVFKLITLPVEIYNANSVEAILNVLGSEGYRVVHLHDSIVPTVIHILLEKEI